MSMPRKVNGTCSECGASFDLTVWDSVNTDLSPDIAKRVVSGEFFKHKCPSCGFRCHVEYLTLYHDMNRSVMIWLVGEDEEFEARLEEIKNIDILPGYSNRIVRNTNELRGKVSALEAGRDDRMIEIIKRFYQLQLYSERPDFNVKSVYYFYVNETETIEFYDPAGDVITCILDDLAYKNISYMIKTTLPPEYFEGLVFDAEWGKRAFDDWQEKMRADADAAGLTLEQYTVMRKLERENEELKQKRMDEAAQRKTAPTEPISDSKVAPTQVKYCRKCGEKLLGDSLFCHKCGTKVIVEPAAPPTPTSPPTQSTPKPKTAVCSPRKHRSAPKWLKPLLLGILALAAVIFFSQNYLKAAFLYDISITEKQDISMSIGDTHTIKYDADIGNLHTSDITWESSDTSIAKVTGKGVITAKGEGTATITASINGISKDSCTVVVSLNVSFSSKDTISLVVGDTHTIKYKADIGSLPSSEIVWQSSDAAIANVSQKGIVTAKNEGTATITASVNGVVRDSCTVIVSLKPVQVKNGQMIVKPQYTGYPEVTINAPKTADCFAYFENISNSANDFAFYVKAGSSATVNAPAGTYNFYYATGDTWYGKDLKFGKDTNFYKSPDRIVLTEDSRGYDILELTLYVVPNGNMDTDPIDENEFPI